MCGRFTQQFTWEEIYEAYNLVVPGIPNLRPNWNVAPTQDVGVVLPEEGNLTYKPMRWGLVPGWAKDTKIGYSLINARVESAAEKPSFRSAWKSRRCLIPASGWFEWKTVPSEGNGKPAKQPYCMSRKDGAPLAFAGLWEHWGPDNLLSCTILTRDASEGLRVLHDRVPLVLSGDDVSAWLGGEPPQIAKDVDDTVQMFPVSPQMNKPSYNEPGCIKPLTQ
jgi:putative SOS response-associated peptidase YedK